MLKKPTILLIVAHSDDQILGPGGTIAKYVKEGKSIKTIIFSYGELSHPHFKKDVITKIRFNESQAADKIIGGDGVEFLDITDGKFKQEIFTTTFKKKLKRLMLRYSPEKIFTHAQDDPHPDHIALHHCVIQCYDELVKEKKFKTDIYTFGVWRFINFKERNLPRLLVDISDTFSIKIKALHPFKSQRMALFFLTWTVYVKAFFYGLKNKTRFAELFAKIR